MLTSLALGVLILLGLQIALVAFVKALRPETNVYATIVIVSVVTTPLALLYGTHHLGQPLGPDGKGAWVLIHLALGGFLFHLMTLPDRSVTLRILVEVLRAPGQALSARALS